jgi:predicted small metal-binding protein
METVLRCDCGFEVRAEDEAELVRRVQGHALETHGVAFTPEEVLQLAFRSELAEPTWQPRVLGRPAMTPASRPRHRWKRS